MVFVHFVGGTHVKIRPSLLFCNVLFNNQTIIYFHCRWLFIIVAFILDPHLGYICYWYEIWKRISFWKLFLMKHIIWSESRDNYYLPFLTSKFMWGNNVSHTKMLLALCRLNMSWISTNLNMYSCLVNHCSYEGTAVKHLAVCVGSLIRPLIFH